MSLKNKVNNLHLEVSQKTNQINQKVDNARREILDVAQEVSNLKQEVQIGKQEIIIQNQQGIDQLEQRVNQRIDIVEQKLDSIVTLLQPIPVSEMTLIEERNQGLKNKQIRLSNKIRSFVSSRLLLAFGAISISVLLLVSASYFIMDYSNTVNDFNENFINEKNSEKPLIEIEVPSKEDDKPSIHHKYKDIEIKQKMKMEQKEINIPKFGYVSESE